jgi:hypothetical protein
VEQFVSTDITRLIKIKNSSMLGKKYENVRNKNMNKENQDIDRVEQKTRETQITQQQI